MSKVLMIAACSVLVVEATASTLTLAANVLNQPIKAMRIACDNRESCMVQTFHHELWAIQHMLHEQLDKLKEIQPEV